MSGAVKALGRHIETLLRDETGSGRVGVIYYNQWVTVAQIATWAECSKPTARRYLKMLCESGVAHSSHAHNRYGRYELYQHRQGNLINILNHRPLPGVTETL